MIQVLMTYSLDFRRHVLFVRQKEGLTFEQTAHRFCVGSASIKRWSQTLHAKPYTRKSRKIDLTELRLDVEKYPDDYQYERAARFNAAVSSMNVALKQIGVTYKKSSDPPQSKRRKAAVFSKPDQVL